MMTIVLKTVLCSFIFSAAIASNFNSNVAPILVERGYAHSTEPGKFEIRLPISPNQDQGKTTYCWMFAAHSAIETTYFATHPNPDLKLELSRSLGRYNAVLSGYTNVFFGKSKYFSSFGVPVDAINYIIEGYGISNKTDYRDYPPGMINKMREAIKNIEKSSESPEEKVTMLTQVLNKYWGTPPEKVLFENRQITPKEFAKTLLMGNQWEAYGMGPYYFDDGTTGYGYHPHPDPSAREGTLAYYVPNDRLHGIIKSALFRGHAVAVLLRREYHDVLIYGARYDSRGGVEAYFIKDSGYYKPARTYELKKAEAESNFQVLTTVKLDPTVLD